MVYVRPVDSVTEILSRITAFLTSGGLPLISSDPTMLTAITGAIPFPKMMVFTRYCLPLFYPGLQRSLMPQMGNTQFFA